MQKKSGDTVTLYILDDVDIGPNCIQDTNDEKRRRCAVLKRIEKWRLKVNPIVVEVGPDFIS
jgi:hypothetical protein